MDEYPELQKLESVCESLKQKINALEATLSSIADGVVVADHEGKFLFFNRAAEQILGIGLQDVDQQHWSDVYGCFLDDQETPFPPDQLPLARAIRGEEIERNEIFVRNPQRPSGVWISVSGKPLQNGRGEIQGGVAVFRDITARKKAYETINLLSSALEQTADYVVITDRSGIIQYANPAVEETTGYCKEEILGQTPRIFKSGQHDSGFYSGIWGTILRGNPYRGTLVNRKKNGEHFWVEQTITPLKDQRGRITHFVSVARDVTEQRKRQEEEIQLRLAREVQQKLYPEKIVPPPGYDFAGLAHPAHATGGDYFDFFPMTEGFLGMAIGDVSGHGISAALTMASTRAYLHAFCRIDADLGKFLNGVNQELSKDLKPDQFVTLLVARLEPSARQLSYANAGHIPCFLLDSSGKIKHILASTHPPLGPFPNVEYCSEHTLTLDPGDLLVFLTDGITEAVDERDQEFTAGRAIEVVLSHRHKSAREIVEAVCHAVQSHVGPARQVDDITCVICKVG